MSRPVNASDPRGERFVGRFQEAWASGDDTVFFRIFREILHPNVRLVQPLAPTTLGLDAFEEELRRVRSSIDGMVGSVRDWASRGDTLFIELELSGTLGGEPIAWPTVDRCRLDADGRCTERHAYFDPSPIAAVIARHPTLWLSGLQRLRGR